MHIACIHRCHQVAAMSIQSNSKVLNRLIARDLHTDADLDIGGGTPRSTSSLNQVTERAPSRFQLRQAALRGPSLSSSQSTSVNCSKSFSSSSSVNISGQDAATAASPSPAHRQQSLFGSSSHHPVDGLNQLPAPLERSGSSILRAASASPVRPPPILACLQLSPPWVGCEVAHSIYSRRLCLECCAGAHKSCRTEPQTRPMLPWHMLPWRAASPCVALLELTLTVFFPAECCLSLICTPLLGPMLRSSFKRAAQTLDSGKREVHCLLALA